MKKITLWLLAVMLIAAVFCVSGCQFIQGNDDSVLYELNSDGFNSTVVFGESVNLDGLKIVKTDKDVVTDIPVDASMITTAANTSSVGATEMKITYEGHTFTVPLSVKYRVTLKADGEVINTLYVMTGAELADITAPEKSGYVFAGWDPEITGTIDGNLTLEATYTAAAPALTEIFATYGDKLGDIPLPSSAAGKWVFAAPDGTVGDAGVREALVKFVLTNGEVLKTDSVKINVAKRKVSFTDVITSFTYNGAKQIPTYTADADVDIIFLEQAGSNYTDAGTYSYYFEVDDPNYEGELEGSYEITKANVTVKINSYTILASEVNPEVTYTVSGFANPALLGLTVTDPDDVVSGAGIYTLTATASNPNVNLTVEPGTLTVVSTVLDVGAPTLSSQAAVYEDKISTITLGSHPNGIWTWQNPNATVGDVGTRTHVAVFTPNDTRYDTLTYNVDIIVSAKPLIIEIPTNGNIFTYTGSDLVLEYVIKDSAGKVYDLEVLGNTPVKNVGTYTRTLTFADTNYTSGNKQVTVVVNKADPVTVFGTTFSTVWSSTLKLSDIALPAGYSWVDPDKKIDNAGENSYGAIYTPADTANYNVATGSFTVDAEKAVSTIINVNNSYDFTYNGNVIELTEIVGSHEEVALKFSYTLDGATVSEIKNVGTYTVTVTLEETTNYKAAIATTTVYVKAADNTDDVNLYQNATYGDKLSALKLPASSTGTWEWKNADANTTVGNAGENKFTAIFTPADDNYNAREVIVTVTVARKKIDAPSINEEMRKQAYTGTTLYSGLASAEGYTVTDNGGSTTGTYNVYITLDTTNYVWSDGSEDNLTLTYEIVAAANAWTKAPTIKSTWVFGDTDALDKSSAEYLEYLGYAEALFGTVTVTYAPVGSNSFSEDLPTNAGKYIARFTATHPDAATKSEDIPFEITKKTVEVPSYTDTYVYTGAGINAGITATELYTVADELKTDAGSYSAKITLVNPTNYVWADGDTNASKNLPYTISKATATIEEFTIGSIKFGEALNPTAVVSLGAAYRFYYSTSIDGEYTATAPTAVGTYFVKVSVLGNENINASESAPIEFSISRADVTISGYKTSYEKTYDGLVFVITGVTASNGATVNISVKKEGADAELLNAGTYTVTLYTEENESYNASSVTVTVTINAAENTDTVKTSQNATYGDKLSSLELPTATNGVWVWTLMDENATVGGAGVNTFTALFHPANDNYKSREVTVIVTVAKATVTTPTPSHSVYDGAHHSSGITANDLYTVSDNGGEDKGTYVAIITLKDPANYKWDSSEDATLYIEYYISEAINSWVSEPAVKTPVEYESTDNLASAEAEHGDVLIEYKGESEDDSAYTTTAPTLPGKYVVRFTTTDENYTKLTVIKSLEITKKKITAPTVSATEFVYTGEKFTLGLAASDYYTVSDEGSTNVNTSLTATLTLNSEYYAWADGTEGLTKVYTYSVIPATNTVTAPVIDGWTYGEEANAPTGSEDSFGLGIKYVYSTAADGEYTETAPTNAGTYYVKAITAATANVNAGESSPVEFTVAKASATISGYETGYTVTYTGSAFTFDDKGIVASNGIALVYAITKDGENVSAIKNAGVYTVTVTLPETANYLGDEVVVTVTVNKVENTDEIPTYTATYGDKLSTLTPPASLTGDWRWKDITDATTVGNAGTATHTLVFTPDDTTNYASREVTVTVTIAKMTLTSPAASSITYVYMGTTYTAGLVDTNLYTVYDEGGVAVGTYTATLTLKDTANYVWAGGTDTLTVTYEITEGTNEITNATIGNRVYGESANEASATAKHGDIVITYKAEGEDDSKYTSTVPTNAGNYIAKFTTTDTNCPIISVTRTFTIEAATVTTPNAPNVYYNGAAQTGGISTNELYTVVGEGGVNVGTYSVTLTLNDKNNYKWSTTGNSSDVSVSFEILKNTITFSNLSAGWTYGNPKEPTVTPSSEFAAQYVIFLYSTDGGATWSAEKPTEVGTYKVKATLSTASENFAATDREADFTIDRAEATLSTPSIAGGKFYKNQLVLSTTGLTATNAGVNVTGTFAFSNLTFGDGTNASSVDLTFTPDNTTNYKPVTKTYKLTLVSVAYLDNSTAYGTVEEAIQAANIKGSGTVWVRPHDPELGPIVITGYDKEIDGKTVKVLEINSGVTLLLPYGTDKNGRNSISSKELPTVSLNGETGPSLSLYDESKCVTRVLVSANVQIINSGILEISGELSGGAMGTNYAGHTAGSYAKLVLGSGASVTSETGSKIYCSGFIVEEAKGNGSSVTLNYGATLYQPFVICDYIDGNYMKAAQGSMSSHAIAPYNRFMFTNVTPTIRYNYGSALAVWAALYTKTTNNNNQTSVYMIGSPEFASDAVIMLSSKEYSYIVAKFDIDTQICDLDVYGGAYTQALEMDIPVGISSTKVSTDDCLFQISYLFNVSLNKSEGQSSAFYDLGQRFKLLPGAVFTVGEDVTLDIRDLIVYETFNDTHHATAKYLYPQKSPATFTVYGKFICEKFGGKIYAGSESAVIIIEKAATYTAYEVGAYEAALLSSKVTSYITITLDAVLVGYDGTVTVGNYRSTATGWETMAIYFNTDGGSAANNLWIDFTDATKYPALPTTSKTGYVFLGWYLGDVPVSSGDDLLAFSTHTLTAHWRRLTWITLDTAVDDITDITVYADGVYPELPTLDKAGSEFLGWFIGDTEIVAGTPVSTNDDHTLVAKWKVMTTITLDTNGGSIDYAYVNVDLDKDTAYPTLPTPTRTGYTFAGWYYGDILIEAGTALQVSGEHTLTAQWSVNSYTATISTDGATVTMDGYSSGDSIPYGTVVSVTVSFSNNSSKKFEVKDANGNTLASADANGTYTFTMPASNVTISGSSSGGCVTGDTLVALADGTEKRIDEITSTDILLVWNFFEGRYDAAPAAILFNHGFANNTVIELIFADGTTVKVVNLHQFLDADANAFVEINKDTVSSLIGHSFIKQNGDGVTAVELVDYVITEEYLEAYGIISAFHYNIIIEGLISTDIMPEDQALFYYFEIDDDMKYDEESVKADIEAYGLYTYEDFAEYLTYEQFIAFNIQYMKIPVGKGIYTYEGILNLIDFYLNKA